MLTQKHTLEIIVYWQKQYIKKQRLFQLSFQLFVLLVLFIIYFSINYFITELGRFLCYNIKLHFFLITQYV